MNAGAVRSLCLGFPEAVEELPFGPETNVFKVGGKIFAIVPGARLSSVTPASLKITAIGEM